MAWRHEDCLQWVEMSCGVVAEFVADDEADLRVALHLDQSGGEKDVTRAEQAAGEGVHDSLGVIDERGWGFWQAELFGTFHHGLVKIRALFRAKQHHVAKGFCTVERR